MTDIVERLRNGVSLGQCGEMSGACREAADEIERLRRQVSLLNGHDTLAVFEATIEERNDEIERLRAALEFYADPFRFPASGLCARKALKGET